LIAIQTVQNISQCNGSTPGLLVFPWFVRKINLKMRRWIQLPFADCETKDRLLVENKEAP